MAKLVLVLAVLLAVGAIWSAAMIGGWLSVIRGEERIEYPFNWRIVLGQEAYERWLSRRKSSPS